jgi:hypothetical protein
MCDRAGIDTALTTGVWSKLSNVTVAEISVSEAFEITKLLEMVSSFEGTPGQNQLVVIELSAEINGIADSVETSTKFMGLSVFALLLPLLFPLLSTTSRAALATTTTATITN